MKGWRIMKIDAASRCRSSEKDRIKNRVVVMPAMSSVALCDAVAAYSSITQLACNSRLNTPHRAEAWHTVRATATG